MLTLFLGVFYFLVFLLILHNTLYKRVFPSATLENYNFYRFNNHLYSSSETSPIGRYLPFKSPILNKVVFFNQTNSLINLFVSVSTLVYGFPMFSLSIFAFYSIFDLLFSVRILSKNSRKNIKENPKYHSQPQYIFSRDELTQQIVESKFETFLAIILFLIELAFFMVTVKP